MKTALISASAWLLGSGAAFAITIAQDSVYRGEISYGPDNMTAASCCPIISGTESFNSLQQYYMSTGPIAATAGFTARLLTTAGDVLASVTYSPTRDSFGGGLGLGLGLLAPLTSQPEDGFFEITAFGADIDFDYIDVASVYDVTVQHPTLGPLATQLQSRNPVTNLALFTGDDGGDDPIDPDDDPVSEVPLPASALLLVAGLGAFRVLKSKTISEPA